MKIQCRTKKKIEKTEDFKEASNRIYSLSPNNFDRTKVLAMMKNYTFKNPNQRRFISPHRRVFSNDRLIQAVNNPTDNTCHHIDMDALKKKLLSPKPSALRPKPKVSENICIEDLFCDSSFNKPLKQANQAKNRKKQLRKLISDSEITEIRNQIWQNINQKKANMEL